MILSTTIAILLAATAPHAALCSDAGNRIEPEARILESDLTRHAAVEAADKLRSMLRRGEVTREFRYGALNQSKIIEGHLLLQQAHADRGEFGTDSPEARESTAHFCRWLVGKGFRYD